MKLFFFYISCILLSQHQSHALTCVDLVGEAKVVTSQPEPLSPTQSLLMQLEARYMRVEHMLELTSSQTQRQSRRMMSQLQTLIRRFEENGDLNERDMGSYMSLVESFNQLEARLQEMQLALGVSPDQLQRYLFSVIWLKNILRSRKWSFPSLSIC